LAEVDGCAHHRGELVDQDRGPQLRDLGILALEVGGDRGHQLEVFPGAGVSSVVNDLHGDVGPVLEDRPMDLGDRTGGERL
jgi:hypothetical protein